jgi:SAM-dependent methyltransferase
MKKLTTYVDRPNSVITGKGNLEHLYTIPNFPVFFGCVESAEKDDFMCDMPWAIDRETGIVQLTKLVPLDILYQAQHVDGTGPTWKQYYKDLADYVAKAKPKSVLEIGGGAGDLARLTTELLPDLHWTIVEPNPWFKETDRIKTVSAFFDKDFKYDKKVDAVVFSQVLEHAYDPHEFVAAIAKFLKPGGKLIFAYPQLDVWLGHKFTNSLNTEHTMLFTDYFVDYVLACHGFTIQNKFAYKEHSHFYVAEKSKDKIPEPKLKSKYTEYKKLFMDFVHYHEEMIKELNDKIEKSKEPIYLFGAHLFSSYLFSFGLKSDKIVGILDNSPMKNGKRLYGTRFKVDSPKILKGKGKVNLILKAGIYNAEISKDILENINSDVTFW